MQELHEKIKHLLIINNLSQNALAEKIGVSKQIIYSLCHGKVKNSKALYPIAKFFGVDYQWLINKSDDLKQANPPPMDILCLDKFQKIPFLATRLLNKSMLIDGKLILDNMNDNYEVINDTNYMHLFALSTTNNALKFRFGMSSILIFHTELLPRSDDFVIAYLPEKELFVYRDLKIENGVRMLIPLDEDIYKPIILQEKDLIVAVLYETRVKLVI